MLIRPILNSSQRNLDILLLLAMSSLLAMIFFDQTGLAVILPKIQREINISISSLPWVMNSYLLSTTIVLIFAGKLGDIFGHKKIVICGSLIFLVSSTICAIAFSELVLLMGRVIQGIGAAFIVPSIGVIVFNHFPQKKRGTAMSIYVGVASIFLSLGPFIGGILAQHISWRMIFWINIPIATLSIMLTFIIVDEIKVIRLNHGFDWFGGLSFAISITAFVVAIMNASQLNWSITEILVLFLIGFIFLFFFIKTEKTAKNPLINLILFKNKLFLTSSLIFASIQICLVTLIFFAIFIQNTLNYSISLAGVLLLPATLPTVFIAPIGGILLDRFGPKLPICLGMCMLTAGMLWIAFFSLKQNYWLLCPGLFLYGIGIPLAMQPTFTTSLSTVEPTLLGVASATITTIRQIAGTIGLAFISAIIFTYNPKLSQQLFFSGDNVTHVTTGIPAIAFSKGIFSASLFAFAGLLLGLCILKNITKNTADSFKRIRLQKSVKMEESTKCIPE
ncbi:MAG: hypothetical protein A3F17_06055 [Gammaproteobacteria bacterium RIFCSPHIGHO2_12_FULL_41_15]|nr:MAG: hypothetical protein A3F17_06055 [Gammaproteobacteria bacterium RIFCSPHIGHO2_12_FULL_41_15]